MAMGSDAGVDAEVTSLETTLDRATESYALAVRKQLDERGRSGGDVTIDQTTALALVRTPTFHVGQLRWRGVEVSDEFLRYAARVARGEQLTPYRGEVLARGAVDFPWHAELRDFAHGPTYPTEPRVRRRKRSKSLLGWARGAGALALCMLLVGVGAAAMTDAPDERPGWTQPSAEPALAAAPAPAALIAREAEPVPSAAPFSTPKADERADQPKVRTRARSPRPALRRAALVIPSPVTAQGPTPIEPVRVQAPAELTPPTEAQVMTVVGSTLLPPLEEVPRTAAPSALLLETPSF